MFDLSLLNKLLVGEHVGESVDILSDDGQLKRVPDTFLNIRSLQGGADLRCLLRGKGSSGGDKGGGEGELHRDGEGQNWLLKEARRCACNALDIFRFQVAQI